MTGRAAIAAGAASQAQATATARIAAVEGLDGGGKSTLVRGIRDRLGGADKVVVTKPAPHCVASFRAIAETDESVLYTDVIPPDLRRLAQLVEVAVHLRYRAQEFAAADLVLFDRWIHTATVYCGDHGRHRAWLERMEEQLPVPRPLLFVRVPADLAHERLVARADRWVGIYSRRELRAKLDRLADRYEEVMATVDHVALDGTAPQATVLADALAAVAAAQAEPAHPTVSA